jgi:hypothetical protein
MGREVGGRHNSFVLEKKGFHPREKDACATWDLLEFPAEGVREGLGNRS